MKSEKFIYQNVKPILRRKKKILHFKNLLIINRKEKIKFLNLAMPKYCDSSLLSCFPSHPTFPFNLFLFSFPFFRSKIKIIQISLTNFQVISAPVQKNQNIIICL